MEALPGQRAAHCVAWIGMWEPFGEAVDSRVGPATAPFTSLQTAAL